MNAIWKENKQYILWGIYALAIALFLAWIGPIVGNQKLSRLIQATVSGILVGGIYALTGLGIVVVTKASGVFNFAHGYMMVIGGLLFWTFFTTSDAGTARVGIGAAIIFAFIATAIFLSTTTEESSDDFWKKKPDNPLGNAALSLAHRLAIPHLLRKDNLIKLIVATAIIAVLMTIGGTSLRWLHAIVGTLTGAVLLGLIIERFAIRPLVGQPVIAMILMTLAVTEVLQGFVQFAWGPLDRTLPIFDIFEEMGIPSTLRLDYRPTLDGIIIVRTGILFAFILAIVAAVGFILFFRYAQIGLAMRAVSEDQQLAQSVGLRVRGILAAVWGIAALLAGIGGVLMGGATSVTPAISLIALRAFPAVLLGGLESIEGVLIGGIVIGLVEQWANLLFPGSQAGPDLAPYLVLMVVLVIRPQGLFGEKIIERI
ncbi:MAG: branched-chain amino acid ABC transporter permease [Anaerolineae bacterium]|nr:branched-chain amino acid ABC transporter permease [Anaerolineae bacterium]MDQ7036746.1 branched-chain amino acid ABC transporter permease [Anaerolineae bacterium]